ncbi:hypothetical protein DMI65_24760 [Escherichia coli]|nr:hypothetical protein [Escherichia coli]
MRLRNVPRRKVLKYYHITRQWQERGNNLTVSTDLYK